MEKALEKQQLFGLPLLHNNVPVLFPSDSHPLVSNSNPQSEVMTYFFAHSFMNNQCFGWLTYLSYSRQSFS